MRNWIFKLVMLTVILLSPVLAESPLGLVTEVTGSAARGEEPLQLLTYIQEGDRATIASDSRLVVSYVEGGLKATIAGPSVVEFQTGGPVIVTGDAARLKMDRPTKRVGLELPSNIDLAGGAAIRRGTLDLHLSRKLLPGPQEITFTAEPRFTDFKLTILDASSYEEVYSAESESAGSFHLPADVLKAGGTYHVEVSCAGAEVDTANPIVVLSDDLSDQLQQRLSAEHGEMSTAEKVELLAICEGYRLDAHALQLVEELIQDVGPRPRLLNDREKLRALLNYL